MTGALIILAAVIAVGLVLYLHHRAHPGADLPAVEPPVEECCGRHAVCEKDSLIISDDTVVYFDDEELDRLKDRDPAGYTPDEEDALREVMLTLQPDDVAPWYRSLTLRGIALTPALRDELLLLISENRKQ